MILKTTTKIIKLPNIATGAPNCKIHPVLYNFYLRLHKIAGARMIHRRKRTQSMCIEITFPGALFSIPPTGRLNTLKEAEECGFWIICRPQTKQKHMSYRGLRVYQLFLSPVHPKKRRVTNVDITSLCEPAQITTQYSVG